MANLICSQYCAVPFCATVCPTGAITVDYREKSVYADADKCNRCGLCRTMCLAFSHDKNLERRRPWISSDWIRARAG
jgi:Fe-S-cluster-containing hydrogenase component 2